MIRPLVRSAFVLLVAAFPVAAEPPDCPPIAGAGELFQAGTVLLVGELHGTEESPAFAGRLACRALAAGLPLIVGLEVFDSEQARFEAFLASSGDAASREALLAGDTWNAEPQYGIASEAMFGLLDELRRLRREGRSIRTVLFNRPPSPDSQSRDRAMARYLAAALEGTEDAFTLVLTGNIHSRVGKGTRWSADYEPMGHLLRRAVAPRRLLSLDVAHGEGTAWMCVMVDPETSSEQQCGPRRTPQRGPEGGGITWNDSPAETGHDGWYHVGSLTASPPAARAPVESAELLWQHDAGG